MSFNKPIFSLFAGVFRLRRRILGSLLLVPAVSAISLLIFSPKSDAKPPSAQKTSRSPLERYQDNIFRSLLDSSVLSSSGVEGKIRNGRPRNGRDPWKGLGKTGIPAPLDRRARFLSAWFRSSDLPLTRKGLEPAMKAFPDLAPVLLWHLAHSEGLPEKSRALLLRLSAQSENRVFNPSERSLGSGERARALWGRYRALSGPVRSGRNLDPEAVDLLRRLVAHHPLSPESGLALLALGKSHLDGSLLIPRWNYLQRMGSNDLVVREAREYLLTSPPFPYADRALYLEARSLVLLGHKGQAMTIIDEALSGRAGNNRRPKAILSELAALRCRVRLGDSLDQGTRCIDRLRSRYPDAYFLLPLVVSALREDLVRPLPEIDGSWILSDDLFDRADARSASWLLGLDYSMRGNPRAALSTWNKLSLWLSAHPDASPGLLSRLLYFRGRLEDQMGHPSRARALFSRVIERASETPYPLWAALSCKGQCGSFRLAPHHPTSESFLPSSLRRPMRELVQMGLFGPALVLERFIRNPGMDQEQFRRYGDLDVGVAPRFRLMLVEKAFFGRTALLMLPTGEGLSPSVIAGFQKSGVPTLWALAIARQESRFHEQVLSVDGALGVMQLMPRTALAVASVQDPLLERDLIRNLGMVRRPAINSLIGGLYLKRLIDSVPGQPERAIAGYNAGLHAVMSWKNLIRADWDFFTESIPYQETRRYVREVLWNFAYLDNHLKGGRL